MKSSSGSIQDGSGKKGMEMDNRENKPVSEMNEQELTAEELQEFMASYKKELAHIYKMASAKKAYMARQNPGNLKKVLEECDRQMRQDIEELKHKYGIHY